MARLRLRAAQRGGLNLASGLSHRGELLDLALGLAHRGELTNLAWGLLHTEKLQAAHRGRLSITDRKRGCGHLVLLGQRARRVAIRRRPPCLHGGCGRQEGSS